MVFANCSRVIKGAGAVIDALDVPTLIGSVAGDDNVIIIMSTEEDAKDFTKKLQKSIKS